MKRHRQKPNEEYNFWQPATDMMSGLVFVLVLIIALLGLYLLSDYTGYEEASSVSSEGPSSSGTGWNNNAPGGWYYDGGTGDGDGDGNGQFDQQIIQTGGGGGYGEDGIKTAVFVEVVDDETERRIPEAGVTFELYRTDTTHLQNGRLQTLNTYYPEKINYRDYETTEEGVFYLPEKIWQGSYYFHELTEPEGYDAAGDTYYDVNRMYDCPDPYVVQIRLSPCKNIIRIQMNDAETQLPVGGGTFRVIAAEDIVTKDGTVRYTQGQYADTIVCDENGYGESKELYLGNYTVQQQTAPNYYTTMQEDLNVEVEKKNGEDPELHEIDAEKTKIALSVTDELNSTGLEGVTFAVSNERTGITQTVTTDAAGNVLLTDLDKIEGDYLLRFMSSQPKAATYKLFDVMAASRHVAKQLHLPVQSGCDRVLRAMNRPYDVAKYLDLITYARRVMPALVLPSDVIIGFPGETEDEAMQTVDLVEKTQFDALFTFIFSPRPGTPAAKMDDPVSREEKQVWFEKLVDAQNAISAKKHAAYIGRTVKVLVDGESDAEAFPLAARTEGNRLVRMKGDKALIGTFAKAKITDSNTWALYGEAVEE